MEFSNIPRIARPVNLLTVYNAVLEIGSWLRWNKLPSADRARVVVFQPLGNARRADGMIAGKVHFQAMRKRITRGDNAPVLMACDVYVIQQSRGKARRLASM